MDTLNILFGAATVVSLAIAVWQISQAVKARHHSDVFSMVIKTIFDMTEDESSWTEIGPVENARSQTPRPIDPWTVIAKIRRLAKNHLDKQSSQEWERAIKLLAERRILWTFKRLFEYEESGDIEETWLVSHDLKPDAIEPEIGELVKRNITLRGMHYTFFYPSNLEDAERVISALRKNIGVKEGEPADSEGVVKIVSVDSEKYYESFGKGNIVLYFRDGERVFPPRCFQELILSKVPKDSEYRAAFWQEHSEEETKKLWNLLEAELKDYSKPAAPQLAGEGQPAVLE